MSCRALSEDRERGDQRLDGQQGHVRLLLDARAHLRHDGGRHRQVLQLQRRRRGLRQVRRGDVGGRRGPGGHRHLQHLRAQLPVRRPRLAADHTLGASYIRQHAVDLMITYQIIIMWHTTVRVYINI